MTAVLTHDLPDRLMACSYHEPVGLYHAAPGVRATSIPLFRKSPHLWAARYVLGEVFDEDEDSNAFAIGNSEHCWALDPDSFPDCIAIPPEDVLDKNGNLTTNAAKEWKAQQCGKAILKQKDWDKVKAMRRALHGHPLAHELIENASERELSIYWRCRATGLERKSRLDLLTRYEGRDLIADLKTASDHSDEAFGRSMDKWGYCLQAAFYQDASEAAGFGRRPFVFIVVRSKPPHVVRVYEPDQRAMALARDQLRRALEEIAERYRTGDWSEVGEDAIVPVDLPRWAYKEDE